MVRIIATSLLLSLLFVFVYFIGGDRFLRAEADAGWPKLTFTLKASGVTQPTWIIHAGDGSERLFITEQRGRILVVKGTSVHKAAFLDITERVGCCGERGLLCVLFPRDYKEKHYFYVNYTNKKGDTVISRFRTSSNPDVADPKSEQILLTIKQPYANHNGGQLAFGPDGYLYIGMGDGGSAGDPRNNGQNPSVPLGKILRIDVESGVAPYGIPRSNPFLNKKNYRSEIWALGMRNPWRFSFDRKTGDLYIADVGQNKYEEIDFEPAGSKGGKNYGWNIMEGKHCFEPPRNCDMSGLVMPAAEYDHSEGCSVTGGFVYRGNAFSRMQGIYFYGDYCSGRIWGMRAENKEWRVERLADTSYSISTFGEDEAGELYLADYGRGNIYKVEALTQK